MADFRDIFIDFIQYKSVSKRGRVVGDGWKDMNPSRREVVPIVEMDEKT